MVGSRRRFGFAARQRLLKRAGFLPKGKIPSVLFTRPAFLFPSLPHAQAASWVGFLSADHPVDERCLPGAVPSLTLLRVKSAGWGPLGILAALFRRIMLYPNLSPTTAPPLQITAATAVTKNRLCLHTFHCAAGRPDDLQSNQPQQIGVIGASRR
jgi:hypothetical protein